MDTKPSLELSDGEYRDDEGLLMASKEDESWDEGQKTPLASRQRNAFALWTILLSSLAVNFSQTWWLAGDAIRHSLASHSLAGQSATSVWGESFDIVYRPLYPKEQYAYTNLGSQVANEMFRSFDPDKGVVALPKGAPHVLPSKEFPWDKTKEVFVLSGYHSLHSVKVLWSELRKLSSDKPLTAHVLHSLHVLWQDTLCAARADPMTISGIVTNRVLVDKFNQTRFCRDWRELEQLRKDNTACYRKLVGSSGSSEKEKDPWAEWQFCPEGSPYQSAVDKYREQQSR
ncbi:cytochrome p450 [Pyrenophora seminiperda CCB06]|uniref:Cytochrome p450 n=1 Tax=Pyrenophora seminiperda CCB06 TaxID=1302712 RepID=A0A3M7MFK0_9PLEO|nr:cytochrome p450 [Pyrenophora seminiperda CCB06]